MSLARWRSLAAREPVFLPFLVVGDPTPEAFVELASAAVAGGARALELGLPHDSAVADGPEVAGAARRALAAGTTTDRAFELIGAVAARTGVPIHLLVYGNLIHARGAPEFCARAVDAGASSLLVPDVPWEESAELGQACEASGLGRVQLVGPRTSLARARDLAGAADAYLYLVSRRGVTGARDELSRESAERIARVSAAVPLPVCAGFGLSRPAHVRAAIAAGARGAVVGSALIRRVRESRERGAGLTALLEDLESECRALSRATQRHPFEEGRPC